MMSDVGTGAGTKSKAGVKVGVKEKEAVKVSPKEKERFEVEWRVLLHNDEVHTFDYVSRKLAEVNKYGCMDIEVYVCGCGFFGLFKGSFREWDWGRAVLLIVYCILALA